MVDERGFAALQKIAVELPAAQRTGLRRFKEVVRDQFLILRLDEERAIAALPKLLPGDRRARETALGLIRRIIESSCTLSEEGGRRLKLVEVLFDGSPPAKPGTAAPLQEVAG